MTASFHAELYNLIPENHQLRKIHSSYCEYYGRPANEPELLFRLLFLQVLYNFLMILRDAAKRLFRVVVKKHPKLEKKLPRLPKLKKDQEDAEKIMLHYLAELGETVETLLPDHEGSISEKVLILPKTSWRMNVPLLTKE
ncbi:hypothetical protein PACILC2_19740 [Paenibacillus cisolokensis]|jgi:hypothetical protein|uniref:Transposase n=1 Tax=Paenibacillus cisolokensis TaxID=1658519 RepID=A0ABQ4N637_9BACL|nr:hypothetical protein PACILC2_19740 [Paenibacillus cisolokensis]